MAEEILIDQVFLKKLSDILDTNYSNEHFGVKELAESIPMNRSQLHRKLHASRGISASQYIREYRLQKAMEMLQNDVVTSSEVSYKVGFNSPTYFNTSFREYYGHPPGEVKYQKSLSSIRSENNDNFKLVNSLSKIAKVKLAKENISKKNLFIISSIIIILIIGLSYNFYSDSLNNTIVSKNEIPDKSIAILPFKDLSSGGDIRWFCEGVTEDLRGNLSQIGGLRVISRTSSERYNRITDKSIPETV